MKTLDRSRDYGTMLGRATHTFEQDGRPFNAQGEEMTDEQVVARQVQINAEDSADVKRIEQETGETTAQADERLTKKAEDERKAAFKEKVEATILGTPVDVDGDGKADYIVSGGRTHKVGKKAKK